MLGSKQIFPPTTYLFFSTSSLWYPHKQYPGIKTANNCIISLRACQLSITPLTTNKSKPSKYRFTLTTMSGLRWKQPETMIASVGPPVMKPITLLVSQIQGFKGRSCLVNWALSWFPYKLCLLHSIYPLPWPWKCSSGSYCGLFLFLISSTQPASSPPPAENESLVVLSPAHSSCGPQPEAVLPPCEALQRMRSSTSEQEEVSGSSPRACALPFPIKLIWNVWISSSDHAHDAHRELGSSLSG